MIFGDLVKEAADLIDVRQRSFEDQLRSLELVFSLWQVAREKKQTLEAGCLRLRNSLTNNLFFREPFLLVLPSSQVPVSVQTRGLLPNLDEPDNLEVVDRWVDIIPPDPRPYLMLDPCARRCDPRWYQRYRGYWINQMLQFGHVPMTLAEGITWLAHRPKLSHSKIDYHCDYLILGTKGKGGKVIRISQGIGDIIKLSVTPWKVKSPGYSRPQFLLTRKKQYHH